MYAYSQLNGLCDVRDLPTHLSLNNGLFSQAHSVQHHGHLGQNTGTHNNNLMFNQSSCQWPSVSLLWTAVALSWGDNVTCLGWQHVVT